MPAPPADHRTTGPVSAPTRGTPCSSCSAVPGGFGGLAALARTPAGQKAIAKAKAYATDPETKRKLGELLNKAMRSRTT